MERPLFVGNVHNLSLEGYSDEQSQLMFQFPCQIEVNTCLYITNPLYKIHPKICCSTIWLHNVSLFTVKKLTITLKTPNATGLVLRKVVNARIEQVEVYLISESITRLQQGIVLMDCHFIQMHSTIARNWWGGLLFTDSNNIHIHNVTASDNDQMGIFTLNSSNIHLDSSSFTNNTIICGIGMYACYNIVINNTISMYNRFGDFFIDINASQIENTIAANNTDTGMFLVNSINVNISNTTLSRNDGYGLEISYSKSVHIDGITVKNIALQSQNIMYCGIFLSYGHNIVINNTTSMYYPIGICLENVNVSQIENTIASNNWVNGMFLNDSKNINISNTTLLQNAEHGLVISYSSSVHIDGTTIIRNVALQLKYDFVNYGISVMGGYDIIINNTISMYYPVGIYFSDINTSQIENTIASNSIRRGIHFFGSRNINISNTTASHNVGGGLSIASSTSIHIDGITITDNQDYGIDLYDTKWIYITKFTAINRYSIRNYTEVKFIVITASQCISIYDTTINVNMSVVSSGELISQPAVITLQNSTLNLSRCKFMGNKITGIKASASEITLSGNLTFSNNSAYTGSAFILVDNSILILTENCRVHFINNHASNTGGVFSIFNTQKFILRNFSFKHNYVFFYNDYVIPISTCFLRTQMDNRSIQNFIFSNNSAGKGGDIVYGGLVAYGLNGKKNCMDTFKAISNISETSLSLISSDPLRVCLCNQSELPDCMLLDDPTPHSIYPGQTISISAVVVGQDWGTVAGSVYAQFLHKSTPENTTCLKSSQGVQSANKDSCNSLHYTIFSMNENVHQMLVLTAQDLYVSEYQDYHRLSINDLKFSYFASLSVAQILYYRTNPVYLSISLLPCPPGFHIRSSKCDCNKLLQQIPGVKCFIQEQIIGRSGLVWVGMIHNYNGTNGTVYASQYCPLNYCSKAASNVTLSESDSQCRYNHSGTLCGGCQPGLSLALGSAQCLPCSNDYLALLIPFTLAGPALVGFIKLLDITISQGTLNGLVFYANIIQVNQDIFLPWRSTHPLTVFIAWLNLDFGVEMCFFNGLDAYSKTWLQFVFPLYVWSIAGLIIILSKYSNRLAKVMGNNSVPVLATLFLLSHAKLFRTIITALSYTMLITSQENDDKFITKAVWSADGNVDYLGSKHSPLFAIAVFTLVFLWLPYTLLLFLGQWLYRCNCRLVTTFLVNTKPFLDGHYGPLKGRHRYWFGALHLVRAAILLISVLVPSDHSSIVAISTSASSVLLMLYGSVVYLNSAVSMFNMAFYSNLILFAATILYIKASGGDPAVAAYTLIGIAFLQFIGLVIFKIACILKKSTKVMNCVKMRRCVDDDWELYEQAALLREMESDTEEQVSESSGSAESLTTY